MMLLQLCHPNPNPGGLPLEEAAAVEDAMDVDPKKTPKKADKGDKDVKGKGKGVALKAPMPAALVQVLAEEMFSIWSSAAARSTTEALLELLCANLGYSVADLLQPFYAPLLQTLLHRPLQVHTGTLKPFQGEVRSVAAAHGAVKNSALVSHLSHTGRREECGRCTRGCEEQRARVSPQSYWAEGRAART